MKIDEIQNSPVSEAVRRRNPHLFGSVASSPKPQQAVRHDPLGAASGEEKNGPRFRVRIKSVRRRTLDTDNLTGGVKYFVDQLRYHQLIPNDRSQDIILEVTQEKTSMKELERTVIEIEQL